MSALSVLTGCQSVTSDGQYEEIVIGMLPELPVLPEFPNLNWQFENERFSLSAEDADRLLVYRDNKLSLYQFEMEKYREKLLLIKATFSKKVVD